MDHVGNSHDGVRKYLEIAEYSLEGTESLSVMVITISILGVPKWTERLLREKCPKSQRRGAAFHTMVAQ